MGDEINSGIPEGQPYPYQNPAGLLSVLWAYPAISLLLMIINLYFIVHAVKTGQSVRLESLTEEVTRIC